ncbi:MAG: type III secretion inner membrane ring lipoprotein SctJ [Victivallales bacterium]|nr:type III secretion inner membrane ring lipoprotein SctJ [Victivallales bacterium]
MKRHMANALLGRMLAVPFLLLALLCLTGCDEETTLYSQLEERQANVVIAALGRENITARKVAGEEGTWNVMIAESRFAEAMGILEREGLPRRKYQGVAESFKKTGMVSSPSEERIRFMDALAQDLSRTISQIEGVVDARVHVVLPENDPFAKNNKPSSAAVAIRHRYDVDMADFVPQIKSLVKNAIEGLDYNKISVTLFRDAPPKNE